MECVKFSKTSEKLKTIRIPVILTVLFVLYYAFGTFVKNELVFSATGKEATGLLLSYSIIAFSGINTFVIIRTQKESFKSLRLLYFTLLIGALATFFIYTLLLSSLVTEYSSSIALKLQAVGYYFTQLSEINVGNIVSNIITLMLFVSVITLLVVAMVIVCCVIETHYSSINVTFVTKEESFTESNINIKQESLGFLYFSLS